MESEDADWLDRVRLLDGVISNPELIWLATEEDKVAFFNRMAASLLPERLPYITVGKPSSGRLHLFPDGLPIGVGSNGRVVFLYLVTGPFDADLRRFLQRHAERSARYRDGRSSCSSCDELRE